MVGFSLYAITLARRAAGFRVAWVLPYLIVAAVFLFRWGLEIEGWVLVIPVAGAVRAVAAGRIPQRVVLEDGPPALPTIGRAGLRHAPAHPLAIRPLGIVYQGAGDELALGPEDARPP